ncbi:phenylalanine--tRNA ligase subunit alpha [Acetobacter indonesiensis]|jgi:phenylalanyl-tRNA synthetase alpha chain|uniref:Phenylalanine--tRNA ligase alpha subunit n=1 Tax=Acetobacter indonesiensis TaxID=104101 RepID=A0A252AWG9_9PROT|nr:phenylalanine--tRNA ligase subunit alpha [Acetobacter indonesiensis]MCG0996181.1 phenylalanine--tRNA ligase subunit alpha [Acetobacter indonesiensis]MCI1438287.1 phenylalanine--tRNA ligase subunit alpha [Acetobacter indonesiensis]MCI1545215.1 phenylalanine--tRNA ligase subunit alpha [Acetobacter indonesiensis]MCI1764541.1 phenylalanine--tRNA ligase subunit alpha [Acetobacter indonesiensis]MCP1230461.1 phenylalanine--tRNA ligase subunit alpha [Acetobacter indonesiensis]
MSDDLEILRQEVLSELTGAADMRAWDAIRVGTLGKSGRLTALLKALGKMAPDERKARGVALNRLRDDLTRAIEDRGQVLEAAALEARLVAERVDVSLPPPPAAQGFIHPIARAVEEMTAIFGAMGFSVAEGPDIETDWHNFSALNTPDHHPARTDHDTFYLPPAPGLDVTRVLRTQTSGVQIRTMLAQKPPIRVICPGRTYRADHDATHSPMFHQCEGLVVGQGITLGHLKGCLIEFLRVFFDKPDLPVRFRSSYFPFTEPSMEVDIGWSRRTGEIGGGEDWLEVLGSGMVHARVLANCGLDPREWQGFAFGMGIERLTMLKNGIPDLRSFYESDIRWLRHYGSDPLAPALLHEGV